MSRAALLKAGTVPVPVPVPLPVPVPVPVRRQADLPVLFASTLGEDAHFSSATALILGVVTLVISRVVLRLTNQPGRNHPP